MNTINRKELRNSVEALVKQFLKDNKPKEGKNVQLDDEFEEWKVDLIKV